LSGAYYTKDIDELSEEAAAWIIDYIEIVLKKETRFTIVLSGGSTPKKLYQLLASDKYKIKLHGTSCIFFWGDERFVPFYLMIVTMQRWPLKVY
jgi:6-phosphogluconolactonase